MTTDLIKPLGRKAYGSIPHLPGSRLGPGDHHCHEGQARICLEKTRDRRDVIYVQEKLDGACTAVARVNGEIVALGRRGYPAKDSKYNHMVLFHLWVVDCEKLGYFKSLKEGWRIVGEWLALAHGTRYDLRRQYFSPWVPFDIFDPRNRRIPCEEFVVPAPFNGPLTLRYENSVPCDEAMRKVAENRYADDICALDPIEGLVYRVERDGKVDFLAKWVRPDKVDGKYLPEISGKPPVWNVGRAFFERLGCGWMLAGQAKEEESTHDSS